MAVANEELQSLLRTGIQAAQSGNKAIARRILEQVIEQDPRNELAWIWMASVAESTAERRKCLEKVLEINPQNERAKQALEKLQQVAPPPAPTPSRPTESPRLTPRLDRAPAMPPSAPMMDRETLLSAPSGRRRRPGILFYLIGLLAVGMIVGGLVMLWLNMQAESATPTAAATQPASLPTMPTQVSAFATSTPIGGTLFTRAPEIMPATWTPTATWTPSPPPNPTATPLPLDTFTLLVTGPREGQPEWHLYTMAGDGSNERLVRLRLPGEDEEEAGLIEVYNGTFSPDGKQLVFTARLSQNEAGEYEELFVAPAGGGTMTQLTSLGAVHTGDAAWSPDGSQIAFASDQDGDYDIYLISPEGGEPRALTFNETEDRDPAWSPDGEFIAFSSDQSGPGFLEVWRMTKDGATPEQLTNDANNSYAPAWSPDGTLIAFVSDRRIDTDLYVMNADGTGERLLTVDDGSAEDRDPAWSPDGRWIAYSSNLGSFVFEVYLIRPDGSEMHQITQGQGESRYIAWQPLSTQ